MADDVDWDMLRHKALTMTERAYAPYSRFPVGAAASTNDGRVLLGCNVENVSYGLGVCAEVALIAHLIGTGGHGLAAISVSDRDGRVLTPCGRCRQVLYEHGGGDLLVDHPGGPRRLADLLPDAFGPDDLAAVAPADDR